MLRLAAIVVTGFASAACLAARSQHASAADRRRVHGCVQCYAYTMYLPARAALERFVRLPIEGRELHERITAGLARVERVTVDVPDSS